MNPLYAALAGRRIFVLYKLVPRADGRTDKVPLDVLTGRPTDAQDSATWMLSTVAIGWAAVYGDGYGVGIVIHEGSQLFCVDIDGAVAADGTPSDIARKLAAEFAGCYIEWSQSGRGLHIIGSYTGEPPTHSTKNAAHHIELYTRARFIALTGRLYSA